MIDTIEYKIHRSSEEPLEMCDSELIDNESTRIPKPLIRSKYPYDLLLIGQSLKIEFCDVFPYTNEAEVLRLEDCAMKADNDLIWRNSNYYFCIIRHDEMKCFEIARVK